MATKDTIYVLCAAFLLFSISIVISGYFFDDAMNDASMEVFSKINDNTTNKEITDNIRKVCAKTPWYVARVDCEKKLLKTFITPAKSGD